MKKIINDPDSVVREMCQGLTYADTKLKWIPKYNILRKKEINKNKVSLISGGGSGHEPAHAGYIGKGMLDAAVCGEEFASPSQIQVYQAIRECASPKGILLIVKNYSGDIMNFKNAMYLARDDGLKVDFVKVDDDIAVQDSLYTVGRRGVAGTVLVHKIVGAAAQTGMELEELKKLAQKTIDRVRSMGFALTSCTVPAKGNPTFELGEEEMEYGVGIHGEPGIQREKILPARELAQRMTKALLADLQPKKEEELCVLINGFGGTPLQELYLLNACVIQELHSQGIKVYRTFAGNYMTSIDMEGASVSFLRLDKELKIFLDAISEAPAFRVSGPVPPIVFEERTQRSMTQENFGMLTDSRWANVGEQELTLENLAWLIDKMGEIIIRQEVPFCELDAHAGDGDFGMSIAKGFRQLKREWRDLMEEHFHNMGEFLQACAMIIMENCGGASGPIWGAAFRMAGKAAGNVRALNVKEFAQILQGAVEGIQVTGERSFGRGAVVGDKTLIDALVPCAQAWEAAAEGQMSFKQAFQNGAQAAVLGAKSTEAITARMGRAGTVGERSIGYPDAGAYALGVIFTELAESMVF